MSVSANRDLSLCDLRLVLSSWRQLGWVSAPLGSPQCRRSGKRSRTGGRISTRFPRHKLPVLKALVLEQQHVHVQLLFFPLYVCSALLLTPSPDCAFAPAHPSSTCLLCVQYGCILELYTGRTELVSGGEQIQPMAKELSAVTGDNKLSLFICTDQHACRWKYSYSRCNVDNSTRLYGTREEKFTPCWTIIIVCSLKPF